MQLPFILTIIFDIALILLRIFRLLYDDCRSGISCKRNGRIRAVADVFDALVTKRSYKNSFSIDDAFTQLEKGSGSQFEPLIVELFVNQKEVVKQLYRDIT